MKLKKPDKNAWILLTDGTNLFDTEVRTGVMQFAKELGYHRIRLVNEEDLEAHYLSSDLFRRGGLGIISHMRQPRMLKAVRKYRIPVVLLGEESVAEWRKAIGGPVTICSVDNRGIGQMAADYLYEQHRFRSFVFAELCHAAQAVWWSDLRYRAFVETLADHGFADEVPRIVVSENAPDVDERRFLDLVRGLPKPVAVFCCNDRAARDVVNFCGTAKLHVPDDVAVLGVDNEVEICEHAPTGISSIRVEHVRLGRTAFRSLLHQMSGEPSRDRVILCPPIRVVERGSTRRSAVADRFVAKALDFIANARLETLDAKAVVKASGSSRSYLTRRFRAETGRTILEAIHLRMMEAVKRELLDTDKTVAQIAGEVGFVSASGLCAVFRRLNGCSMSEFRASRRL